jgi:hypothetical protein
LPELILITNYLQAEGNDLPPVLLKKYMSEETPLPKKAVRKATRKKSASKRAPKKSAKSESADDQEKELPLDEKPVSEDSSDAGGSGEQEDEKKSASKAREPKSGVRDARRETADEPIPDEIAEKLVPDLDDSEETKEKGGQKKQARKDDSSSGSKEQGQGRQESGERRGRGRGRGGRERGERSERSEKREPKPRVTVDSKDLAKKAWKIFESEVTEEGLALLDDNGLRDYARSSFNAARLFLEEKERVTGREKQAKAERKRREKERNSKNEQSEKDED